MKLYNYFRSSTSYRARIALKLNELDPEPFYGGDTEGYTDRPTLD
ncbi:hypothetical protein ACPF7Z_18595 [Halomonas sp. GXIMD04776]